MLTAQFMHTVAKDGYAISEQFANEKHEIEWQKREAGDPLPRVPLLERKPLETSSDWTLEVLRTAAGNPYRYEAPDTCRSYVRPLLLDRATSVGEAMFNIRDRLTYMTALLQEFDVPMGVRRGPNSHLRDTVVDLAHEAASFLAVLEIATLQEHSYQVRSSLQPA
ncbi:hypothetical protein [Mitsuaria sp. GD03876]|uniref:hypothetical protein n=1 Tax=Mitsuaria sp. GD03876 TaxID=2975399 RepID=UPI00244B7FFB|nr:hypothetical protein [Mitsuaria sp. GD03876]MDH0865150.1 hypothetical protein [Mitsuaria sp. GD03876]